MHCQCDDSPPHSTRCSLGLTRKTISGFRLCVILAPLNSPTKSPLGGKSCNKKSQTATDGEGSLLWKCDAKHFQVNGNIGGVEKMGDEKGGGHG